MLVPQLDRVQLLLESANVLLFGHFHLLEDFFLSVQFPVQILSPGDCFIHLVLEFQVLLLQYLDLAIRRVELDFCVLQGQDLVFELTARVEEARISGSVTLLLVFVPLDPELTRLFLIGNDFVQTLNSVVELVLRKFERLLNSLLLNISRHLDRLQLSHFLVSLFEFLLSLVEQVVL